MLLKLLKARSTRRLVKLPLQGILITPFVLQIATAVGLVGYLSFRNGQQAVNDLASQLRSEISARIQQQLKNYVEIPYAINQINANSFFRGEIDPVQAKGVYQLWQQALIYPNTNLIYCASSKDGSLIGVGRSLGDRNLQVVAYNAATGHRGYYYTLDIWGNRTYLKQKAHQVYDARVRPWYRAAESAEGPAWSKIYRDFDTRLPTLTASLPIFDRTSNHITGVCATDFILPEEMSRFLRSLEVGKAGRTFIIDREGLLVASSTYEDLMIGAGKDAKRRPALESNNPLIKETAAYLQRRFRSLNEIQNAQQLDFTLQHQRRFLQILPFQDAEGLDWLIVVVIPEADFMTQINANIRNTIILCVLALGLAIALGILTARWINRPIYRVSQASKEIAKGDLNQHIDSSIINEIDALATSFNSMAGQLQQSFAAVRQSEATNRAIVNTIPDLMIRVRGDGTYIDFIGSDRLKGVYGVQQFIPGSKVSDSLPPDLAQLRMHHIQQALQTGKLQIYEQQITVNGQVQDEEIRILVLGEDEVLIMVRDITDRKRAEEQLRIAEENYRGIFENALEGIFQSSPMGYFINVNPAMARIYGYESPPEMVNTITNIAEQMYVDPEDSDKFYRTMHEQGEIKRFEYRTYQKDGSIIWVQEDTRAVCDNKGKLLYYEGIIQDITERKRREYELRKQLEELRIEIDHKKRDQEVAMITESGYFQELQAEVNDLNLDEFWG
jgi:PAS domain S-box-containing protein